MNRFPLFFTTSRGKRENFLFGNVQLSLTLWRGTLMLQVAKNLILLLLLHCIDSFLQVFFFFLIHDFTAGSIHISSLTNHKQRIFLLRCSNSPDKKMAAFSFCKLAFLLSLKRCDHLKILHSPQDSCQTQLYAKKPIPSATTAEISVGNNMSLSCFGSQRCTVTFVSPESAPEQKRLKKTVKITQNIMTTIRFLFLKLPKNNLY